MTDKERFLFLCFLGSLFLGFFIPFFGLLVAAWIHGLCAWFFLAITIEYVWDKIKERPFRLDHIGHIAWEAFLLLLGGGLVVVSVRGLYLTGVVIWKTSLGFDMDWGGMWWDNLP